MEESKRMIRERIEEIDSKLNYLEQENRHEEVEILLQERGWLQELFLAIKKDESKEFG